MPNSDNRYKILSIILIILLLFASIFIFTDSDSGSQEDLESAYKTQIDSLKNQNSELNSEIDELRSQMLIPQDSDIHKNLDSDSSNDSHGYNEANLSADEKYIIQLVKNMHQGYSELNKTKDPNSVLKYFTPRHSTNEVTINVQNLPSVKKHDTNNFKDHLQFLAEIEGLKIKMGTPYFKNIYVQGNIFNAYYVADLLVEKDGGLVEKAVLIASVSGQKNGNEWRIGNFSWMKFDKYDKLKLKEPEA
ncbi:hypothetical protein [Marinigracilibium pacificum]|uniref:Uncharacterized protein n=1 Tax=Marinigracilibium pacificum TaxID=2729599 RepID=A0A848J145_9BACT|nr:hypothetical protein [Marinigracilibium pacificum]NMM48204.1 hypothetical protein [Marinigracilibium pacificum]